MLQRRSDGLAFLMKTISQLLFEWERLKLNKPTHGEQKPLLQRQIGVLSELSNSGCTEIPGELLPVRDLLAAQQELASLWR